MPRSALIASRTGETATIGPRRLSASSRIPATTRNGGTTTGTPATRDGRARVTCFHPPRRRAGTHAVVVDPTVALPGGGAAGTARPSETGTAPGPVPTGGSMPAPELDPVTSASGPGPDRPDGYADLRSYAPIGDTRTVALVALDGRIDWWPIPDLDSCPTFAAILDAPNGGRLELAPTEPARRVEGVAGRVPMRFAVAPGTCLNSASPWAHDTVHGTVLRVHDVTLAVRLLGEVETEVTDQAVRGTFRTTPGSRHLVGVTASESEPLHLSTPREVDARLDRTVEAWRRWSGQFRAPE